MSDQELLDKLNELKTASFKDGIPNLGVLRLIRVELLTVKKSKREFLKPFVKDLKSEMFKNRVRISGFDFVDYFPDSQAPVIIKTDKTVDVKIDNSDVKITFDELLIKLLHSIQDTLSNLKGYAIIKLSNQDNSKYQIKVLHDDKYYSAPITNKINKTFNECDSSTISEYSNAIENGETTGSNVLCLVLLTSKINNIEAQQATNDNLKIIIDSFDEFEYCTIKEFGNYKGAFYKRNVEKEDFFEEVNFVTSKFLTNGKISFEEEKVIKKAFESSSAPVLTYKLLKGGNSGAKVIEIRQIPPFAIEQYERRYIIKFSKRDDKRKLKRESERFADFIDSYEGFEEYNCSFYNTPNYDALKYTFAKSKGALVSYPFADILDDEDNQYYDDPSRIISEIFNQEIFQLWKRESIRVVKKPLKDLYSGYVKFEKIKKQVLIIRNESQSDFEKSDFNEKLNKLLNHQLEINEKICHGDLHSENFFKDDKSKLFLIDFGFTGIEHSIIDHTSLECSVKFNHMPRYLSLDILTRLEEELLLDQTFESTYEFKEAKQRKDLVKYCEIIRQIRINSEEFIVNGSSKTEYYISLFFMTYRQVRYPNMNQLYALKSAEILLNKIMKDLGL